MLFFLVNVMICCFLSLYIDMLLYYRSAVLALYLLVQNLRGQELPAILTEDVDEESAGDSYPTHYHTVTGATPGIQQMLKPMLLSKAEKERHRSGDDINLAGKKKTSLMDVFRPRSKSDASKLKKPNFMSKMQVSQVNCRNVMTRISSRVTIIMMKSLLNCFIFITCLSRHYPHGHIHILASYQHLIHFTVSTKQPSKQNITILFPFPLICSTIALHLNKLYYLCFFMQHLVYLHVLHFTGIE